MLRFAVIMLIENRLYSIQIAKFSLRGAAPHPAGALPRTPLGHSPRPLFSAWYMVLMHGTLTEHDSF